MLNIILQTIQFQRIRVLYQVEKPLTLPQYKGSVFRGCLGANLHREVCTRKGVDCAVCQLKYTCVYSCIFNSFVPETHPHHRKYPQSPHPYVLSPLPDQKTEYQPGDTLGFELTLTGDSGQFMALLPEVIRKMGQNGFGKSRGKCKPIQIEMLTTQLDYKPLHYFETPGILMLENLPQPEVRNRVEIEIETPLRMKNRQKLLKEAPAFRLFTERLVQRLGLLAHFHGGAPWIDSLAMQYPDEVQILKADVQQVDWRRYSGTQDTTMSFDGLVGHITYEGKNMNHWMPLLTLGSWLHVGSTATFGLGKYSIEVG
jgi:hypothetical protein